MIERTLKLIILDIVACSLSLVLSFYLRFDFQVPDHFYGLMVNCTVVFSLCQIIVFFGSKLYLRIWRYTSIIDLIAILKAVIASSVLSFSIVFFLMQNNGYPRSVFLIYMVLNFLSSSGLRLSVRVFHSFFNNYYLKPKNNAKNETTYIRLNSGAP